MKLTSIIILILCSFFVFGRTSYMPMDKTTARDGMFGDRILKTSRDKDGYLWMLGIGGVSRFDGKYFVNFKQENDSLENSIRGRRFHTFCQDSQKNIWVGGDSGLNLYQPENKKFIPFRLGDRYTAIRHVDVLNDSTLIVSCPGNTIYTIHVKTHQVCEIKNKYTIVRSISNSKGERFQATTNGLVLREYKDTVLQTAYSISGLCFSPKGKLFVSSSAGVSIFEKHDNEFKPEPIQKLVRKNEELTNSFAKAMVYFNHAVWVATNNGLNRIDLDKDDNIVGIEQIFNDPIYPNSLLNNLVNDLYVDFEGILWISTHGGLNRIELDRQWFSSIKNDPLDVNSVHDNNIFSLAGDGNRNIWMGSYGAGLSKYRIDKDSFEWFHRDNSQVDNHINYAYSDLHGIPWIISRERIFRYLNNELKLVRIIDTNGIEIENLRINAIIQHPSGDYWAASNGQLYQLDLKDDLKLSIKNEVQLSSKNNRVVIRLYCDEFKRIWVASTRGIFMVDPQSPNDIVSFNKEINPLFRSNVFQAVNADNFGNIWFGSDNGLYIARKDSNFIYQPDSIHFDAYFEKDGLTHNYITSFFPDQFGSMWISSWNGIMRYNPNANDIARFIPYGFDDGVISEKYNRQGGFKDTITETIYFGSANGVSYFQPEELRQDFSVAQVLIHSIEVDGKIMELEGVDRDLELSFEKSLESFEISYSSSSLLLPEKQVFAWRVNEVNDEWTLTRDRKLVLNDLNNGIYNLEIAATSFNGMTGIPIKIQLKVYSIWKKVIIWIFIIVLILSAIVVYFWIEKRNKKTTKYAYSNLTTESSSQIIDQLKSIMENEKPYLNPDLTSEQLARKAGISAAKLSQVLNEFLQTRFYEYLNQYRVEEFVDCLEDPENKKLTLIALAEKCGFSSKSTFYRIFKEQKGMTPAQYAKSIKS